MTEPIFQSDALSREVQHIEVPKTSPEALSSPHDILGKEYDFNGVSFTVLGIDKEFYCPDDERNNLFIDQVTVITVESQRILVIPFQGGIAKVNKIQIGDEIITGFADILRCIVVEEYALEGWMTNRALAKKLGVDKETTASFARNYRKSNPEWFQNYRFPGHSACEHYSQELCDIIRDEIVKRERSPSGWKTNESLAFELGESRTIVVKCADIYRQSNPEWFYKYVITTGHLCEHYSPELCAIIRNEVSQKEQAPKGWMTNHALMIELGVSAESTIRNRANPYRQSHQEWFHEYRTSKGHMREHYSPQLCNLICDEITRIEQAPEGWMTNNRLAKKLGISDSKSVRHTNSYRQSHPEWFHTYKTQNNLICEHYSPKLCEMIEKEIRKSRCAPEGWMTNGSLAKELGIGNFAVEHYADTFRQSNPEWFHKYRDTGGRSYEHYSPQLCTIIRNELLQIKPAPEGWMTNRGLADEFGISEPMISRIAKRYSTTHPEWCHEYRARNNKMSTHYSPELCAIIRNEITKIEDAPDGWMTVTGLAHELNVKCPTIKNNMDPYYHSNPEWFYKYRARGGKVYEHVSPQLCDVIRNSIAQAEDILLGWETSSDLAQELNVHASTITHHANTYRHDYPNWFRSVKIPNQILRRCYSPELCDRIRSEITKAECAHADWMTRGALRKQLQVHERTIGKMVNLYTQSHPEWFHEYKGVSGRIERHYSPELCNIVREALINKRS